MAYDVVTSLGTGVGAHRQAFRGSCSGLAPDDSFGAPVVLGRVRDLEPLPPGRTRYSSRAGSIVHTLAERLRPTVRKTGISSARIGVVIGTSTGGLERTEAHLRGAALDPVFDLHAQHAIAALPELAALVLGAEGPRVAVSTACTSGAKAFAIARRWLALGMVDLVVVGGADGLCGTTVRGFASLGVLSDSGCVPFGRDPSGMSVAEGGALFLLARDGDAPARLVGYGESSDAHHLASPDPTGEGAELAIRRALDEANLETVDHVNAHGTGTRHNDEAEAAALSRTVGRAPLVASTKGATGHLLGAAGSVEAAFALMAIEDSFVPSSLGADVGLYADRITLNPAPCERRIRSVLSTSLAFGGSNTALVFASTENA